MEDRTAAGSRPPARTGVTARESGWAVPGSIEDQTATPAGAVAPPATTGHPAGGARPGAPAGGGAVPTVGLRPMTVADILDGGFAVVKARPRRILGLAAVFVVPTRLLAAYLQRDVVGSTVVDWLTRDPVLFDEPAGDGGTAVVAGLLATVVSAAALVCVAAAVGHLVTQWAMGRDAPAGEMVGVIGRRWWPLLASFVLVKLVEGLGLLGCYIGALFVMPLFVAVAPIIGVEGAGPIVAMRRSARLARARYWRTLGIAVLMGIVATLLATALSALPQLAASWLDDEGGWAVLALGSIVAEVVTLPFVAAATVLLYLDLRVRLEGFDIEMTAIDVLDRAR